MQFIYAHILSILGLRFLLSLCLVTLLLLPLSPAPRCHPSFSAFCFPPRAL